MDHTPNDGTPPGAPRILVLGATGGTGRLIVARRWSADTTSPRSCARRRKARGSGLDWVLLRPSLLNGKAGRGTVRALADLSSFHGETISRADVARFALDQASADTWLHRSPVVTW